MAGMIAPETIEQVREHSDIVRVIGDYVKLKKSGDNYFGLCPFHGEKTPSFSVNAGRQFFYCFGCGAGGNVFNFLMRIEGLGFAEAVHKLAGQAGIEIKEEQRSPEQQRRLEERERLQGVMAQAAQFYHEILLQQPEGAEARAYLRRRGYSGDMVRRFQLGFAPAGWDTLMRYFDQDGVDPECARSLGLVRCRDDGREYDMFRRRLLFPVQDAYGNIVAFGGRVLDSSLPKYINSPESSLYHKGRTLYGLYAGRNAMRRQQRAIVVEGYFDHLALAQAGFDNVVATCGTSLTAEHAALLKRYVDTVVVLFDQDDAGQAACFRALPLLLQAGLKVQTLSLAQGEDPDSYLARHGKEAFAAQLEQACSALGFFMRRTLERQGDSAEARSTAIEEILAVIGQVSGEIEISLHLQELSTLTGVPVEVLQRQLGQVEPPQCVKAPERNLAPDRAPLRHREQRRAETYEDGEIKAQKMLLTLMIQRRQMAREVAEVGIQNLFSKPQCRAGAELICLAHEQGREPGSWLLDQCEDGETQEIFTAALVEEDRFADEVIEKVFSDCRTAVNRSQLKQRRAQLHAQMCEAERSGDIQMQNECLRELTEINRRIKR